MIKPKYLSKGFTITQWVRFKDKVSQGTLFNYGNPVRQKNPMGYKLETITVKEDDFVGQNVPSYAFQENNYERFVRLVVLEQDGTIRDSNTGSSELGLDRYNTQTYAQLANEASPIYNFTYEHIPMNFDEWYFITATYNPTIDEDLTRAGSPDMNGAGNPHLQEKWWWKGNLMGDMETFKSYSGYGAKCKVDIISKTQLLNARGYKVK